MTALLVRAIRQPDWSGAVYGSAQMLSGPFLMAVSALMAMACLRDRSPIAEDAPVSPRHRTVARLLAGVPFVVVMAAVVAPVAIWLRRAGGLDLGDEPGRTLHAHFTVPELLQPVVLTALAVALGAAVARVVRNRLGAVTVLFVLWFMSSLMYWALNGPTGRFFALVQSQPITARAGSMYDDPTTFPSSWLLSAPGQYQDFWGRIVVSPSLAAWHDVYLVGLAALFAGIALRGRSGRMLMAAGLLVAVIGVVLQKAVHP
ncbi:MAG TPA: hypothetical protein VFL94_09390 [Actinomycetales bacterium]|nr:hypothetical protein [Actinomycetales bacterium]